MGVPASTSAPTVVGSTSASIPDATRAERREPKYLSPTVQATPVNLNRSTCPRQFTLAGAQGRATTMAG